jgi:sarcosine oxidase subunit alpha
MSTVQFTFDGVTYHGNKGEPLSAALLRNGIKVVTESSYRYRPRGVVGLGYEEPCALVQVDSGSGEPMVPATRIELVDGLVVRSLAGVGDLPNQIDKARYDKTFKHVDVLVIGAGLSGLKAAQKAANSGKTVIILDDQFQAGGYVTDLNEKIDPSEAYHDMDAIQTLVDGKRELAFMVEKNSSPSDWNKIQKIMGIH